MDGWAKDNTYETITHTHCRGRVCRSRSRIGWTHPYAWEHGRWSDPWQPGQACRLAGSNRLILARLLLTPRIGHHLPACAILLLLLYQGGAPADSQAEADAACRRRRRHERATAQGKGIQCDVLARALGRHPLFALVFQGPEPGQLCPSPTPA